MMAFIVPGLLTWSLGIAEVSLVPGRACANTWYSSDAGGMPEASSSEMRRYWLPIAPLMLAHSGLAGSSGGLSGSKAMWQEPQLVPIRNGGSIAPSARRRTCESADAGTSDLCRLYPYQMETLTLSFRQDLLSKRGFGELVSHRAWV